MAASLRSLLRAIFLTNRRLALVWAACGLTAVAAQVFRLVWSGTGIVDTALFLVVLMAVATGVASFVGFVVGLAAIQLNLLRSSTVRAATVSRSRVEDGFGAPGVSAEPSVSFAGEAWRQPPLPDPLLDRRTERAVAIALAAVRVSVPDTTAEVVQRSARRLPRPRTRQKMAWRTAPIVEFQADVSSAMEPFRADVEHLFELLCRVVGADSVSRFAFDRDPNERWMVADDDDEDFDVAAQAVSVRPGAAVVIATDFGVGRPRLGRLGPPGSTYALYAHRVMGQRGTPRFVVPYAQPRWPHSCRRLTVMVWDEPKSVGKIRRGRAGL